MVLDTPGGSPVASENLYRYFKELGKRIPLYMYVNSAAVSGGYYIAVAGDKIYANKNAMVGRRTYAKPLPCQNGSRSWGRGQHTQCG